MTARSAEWPIREDVASLLYGQWFRSAREVWWAL
jgi:hypothetical protein